MSIAADMSAKERKSAPIWSGVINYFPDAIIEVAMLSQIGNEQHNPGKSLHWDRSKSGDEKDALARHLVDAGTRDSDGVRHSTKVAWRALANLQKEIEQDRDPTMFVVEPDASQAILDAMTEGGRAGYAVSEFPRSDGEASANNYNNPVSGGHSLRDTSQPRMK